MTRTVAESASLMTPAQMPAVIVRGADPQRASDRCHLFLKCANPAEGRVRIEVWDEWVPACQRCADLVDLEFSAAEPECEGHESLAGEHMGETVFCDGSCQR